MRVEIQAIRESRRNSIAWMFALWSCCSGRPVDESLEREGSLLCVRLAESP